jgi:hypothetical protein
MVALAKSLIDAIIGLPQMIVELPKMLEMVGSFGEIFGNLGQVFEALIGGMVDEAERLLPPSWASQCAKPTASNLLGEVIRFIGDPLHFEETCTRWTYDTLWVVGGIIGFVVGMIATASISILSVFSKVKSVAGVASAAGKAAKAADTAADATRAASRAVNTGVHAAGASPSAGQMAKVLALIKAGRRAGKEFSQEATDQWKIVGRLPEGKMDDFIRRVGGADMLDDLLKGSQKAKKRMSAADQQALDARWAKLQDNIADGKPFSKELGEIDGARKLDDALDKDWTIEMPGGEGRVDFVCKGPDGQTLNVEVKYLGSGVSDNTIESQITAAQVQLNRETGGGVIGLSLGSPAEQGRVAQFITSKLGGVTRTLPGGATEIVYGSNVIRFFSAAWPSIP